MIRREEIIAERMLGSISEIFLSSMCLGMPRSSVITKLMSEGFGTIYFAAPSSSQKVQNIQFNPNASICYYHGISSVTLIGHVQFVTDISLKRKLWGIFIRKNSVLHISEYDFCPMVFITHEATFWIENRLTTYQYIENDNK